MLGAVSRNNAIAGGLDHSRRVWQVISPGLRGYLSRGLYPDWAFLLTHWPFVRPMKKPRRLGFQVVAVMGATNRKSRTSRPKPDASGFSIGCAPPQSDLSFSQAKALSIIIHLSASYFSSFL